MLLRSFDAATEDEWRSFLQTHDFGQLVLTGKGRPSPMVVPAHFALQGSTALLHLARPNPAWAYIEEEPRGLLCVVGAYAYVPSDVNGGSEDPEGFGVPTSYYAAVQLEGRLEVVDDPAELAALLQAMMDHFEPNGSRGRQRVSTAPPDGPQLRAIVGLRLHVAEVRAKFKFGGNRTAQHRRNVAAWLGQQETDLAKEAAEQTLRRTPV